MVGGDYTVDTVDVSVDSRARALSAVESPDLALLVELLKKNASRAEIKQLVAKYSLRKK
jgi:hypothetical protein